MFWKGIHKFNNIQVAPGGAAYGFGEHVNSYRRVYYVNNITGSSANVGTSWDKAMDEVSTAITASETFRADRGSVTTNDYIRNVIVVQGTGTAYTKLTALPLYTDIIGLGADPRGNGAGIARIGSDTVAESGCVSSSTVRGLNMYNLQFQAGLDKYCLSSTSMFRSRIENCTFMTNGSATGNPTSAIYSTTAMGGVVFRDCVIGGSNCSVDTEPDIGMKLEGTHFHTSQVRDCQIYGLAGVTVASTMTATWGGMFKDCVLGDGSQTMAICVNDDSTGAGAHILYVGCYAMASGQAFDIETNGTKRVIGCYEINGFIAAST